MKIYAFDEYREIAKEIRKARPEIARGIFRVGRFPNGEVFVRLPYRPSAEPSLVIGTAQPPDRNLLELSILCHSLRRRGSDRITAILPYLAYSRQDKPFGSESAGAAWLGKILSACGVTKVATLDVHSKDDLELFPIPLISLPSCEILAGSARPFLSDSTTVIAPDEGATRRCQEFIQATGLNLPLAKFEKIRLRTGIESRLLSPITDHALIVDDILDTGSTLVACCKVLWEKGARKIDVVVSHGLFTGRNWLKMWDLGVRSITCTNSVAGILPPDPRVQVVSCTGAFLPFIASEVNSYVELAKI